MKCWVVFLNVCSLTACFSPVVRIENGELVGKAYRLSNNRTILSFLGIPYAAPPVHENRFKEPQNLKSWTGVWNATMNPAQCLQYTHGYSIVGEEDCLYLNVYTPKLPESDDVNPLMDVLVYIHPGAFMYGQGYTMAPDYLLQKSDIVFVSINYRVGVLGFFSSGDTVVPGNNGLKDQVTALKWIQRNIIKFGGNPDSVTISGCSAGGASVHYHMMSPLSDGLFQKAISMSGTALPPWTLPPNITEKSIMLAAFVGCVRDNSTQDMVDCLRQRPALQLVETMKNFIVWRYCPFTAFGPVIEPTNLNSFLSEEPVQLLRSGRVKNVPWLVGLCKEEGLYPAADFISNETLISELNVNWFEIAPHLLMYNFSVSSDESRHNVSAKIRRFYFGDRPISNETVREIIQMLGDRVFYNDIIPAIKLHVSSTNSQAFCYKFSYRGKYSLSNIFAGNSVDYGTSHADDLFYLLKSAELSTEETQSDSNMIKVMTDFFISFIKTGNPNNDNLQWKPVSTDSGKPLGCLEVLSPTYQRFTEINNTLTERFWMDLFEAEYSPPPAAVEFTRADEL